MIEEVLDSCKLYPLARAVRAVKKLSASDTFGSRILKKKNGMGLQ
jgi:hypothetical protein